MSAVVVKDDVRRALRALAVEMYYFLKAWAADEELEGRYVIERDQGTDQPTVTLNGFKCRISSLGQQGWTIRLDTKLPPEMAGVGGEYLAVVLRGKAQPLVFIERFPPMYTVFGWHYFATWVGYWAPPKGEPITVDTPIRWRRSWCDRRHWDAWQNRVAQKVCSLPPDQRKAAIDQLIRDYEEAGRDQNYKLSGIFYGVLFRIKERFPEVEIPSLKKS